MSEEGSSVDGAEVEVDSGPSEQTHVRARLFGNCGKLCIYCPLAVLVIFFLFLSQIGITEIVVALIDH